MNINLVNQLLCSTIKIDKRLSYYGEADVFNISALKMIYNIIECNSNITHKCLLKLENIAQKLINESPDICNIRGESVTLDSSFNNSIQILTQTNTPPSIDDVAITFDNGDSVYTFNDSQFKVNFTDAEGDLPELVRIVTLPATGTLKFNNEVISAGYLFNIEDSNKLTYTRTNTQYIDPFIFQTSDNNTTNKLFSNMATFTITVDAQVNQPPSSVGDGSTTTSYGTTIVFTRAMFTTATTPPYADPEGDAAATLKILSLPAQGELRLNGIAVLVNDEIDFADIDSGLFTYVPDNGTTTAYSPDFNFAIADAGSGQFTS